MPFGENGKLYGRAATDDLTDARNLEQLWNVNIPEALKDLDCKPQILAHGFLNLLGEQLRMLLLYSV